MSPLEAACVVVSRLRRHYFIIINRLVYMQKSVSHQAGCKQTGFTLLELMVTIGIIGILVGIGVPSISDWIQRSQVRAETQKYVGILSLARSTAITNNQVITVEFAAPDADGSIDIDIFSDDDGAGNEAFAAGDVYIRQFEGEATTLVTAVMPDVDFISFDGDGRLMSAAIQIDISNDNANLGRLIDINPVGRTFVSGKVF